MCDRQIKHETPFVERPLRHAACAAVLVENTQTERSGAAPGWGAESWVVELYDRQTKEILRGVPFDNAREADAFERKIRLLLKNGNFSVRNRREVK
jgi:hypothetical protein